MKKYSKVDVFVLRIALWEFKKMTDGANFLLRVGEFVAT